MELENEGTVFQMKSGALFAKITGDVDHHKAKRIKKEIDSHIFVNRPESLVLDLSEVDFMDSSGLGLILGRYQLSTELGISFAIYEPTEAVSKIIKIGGCEKIINIIRKKEAK